MILTQNKTIKISLLLTGMCITGYLLLADKTENDKVIVNASTVMPDYEVHDINHEKVVEQNDYKKKSKLTLKKKEVGTPTVKLKPNHLYVRSSEDVQKVMYQREENRKRYLQMKKNRENQMRQQRFQQHINQRKGKEDV